MRRKLKTKSRLAGFTITEVTIASALLIIALVPILRALTVAQVSAATIERKTRSLMLAQAKLDDIRARSIYNYTTSFTETNTSLGDSYLCTVADAAGGANLKLVGVAVGYDLNGNSTLQHREIEVVLATLIARRL